LLHGHGREDAYD